MKRHIDLNYVLTQFLTEHGKFNSYFYRFQIKHSNVCICDNQTKQDVEHLILNCPKINRNELIMTVQSEGRTWPIPPVRTHKKRPNMENVSVTSASYLRYHHGYIMAFILIKPSIDYHHRSPQYHHYSCIYHIYVCILSVHFIFIDHTPDHLLKTTLHATL